MGFHMGPRRGLVDVLLQCAALARKPACNCVHIFLNGDWRIVGRIFFCWDWDVSSMVN